MATEADNLENIKEGPLRHRHCTDVFFGLLFVVFLAAMVVAGLFGYNNGNPELLLHPFDSSGNQCGREVYNTSDYRKLYFVNPIESIKITVCVAECPTDTQNISCYVNAWVTNCDNDKGLIEYKNNGTIEYAPINTTINFMDTLCIPVNISHSQAFYDSIKDESFVAFEADLTRTWKLVLIVVSLALGISLVYLIFLRYFIKIVLWVSIIGIILTFTVFGYFLQYSATNKYAGEGYNTTRITLWALAILFYGLSLLFLILSICAKKKIDLASAIMKSSVFFIGDVWTSLFVPFAAFIVGLGVIVFWILALVYLYTSGTLKACDPCLPFAEVEWNYNLQALFWFELLGIFWINAFKVAACDYIISYAATAWYFQNKTERGVVNPVSRGVKTLFSYHLGSISLGSLIIGITLFLRFFLKLLVEAAKRGQGNTLTKIVCFCCICCIGTVEKLAAYLDDGVYIRIAMTGENFCVAARNSFKLIIENSGRYLVLGGVTSYFTFIGQLGITLTSTYLGYILLLQDVGVSHDLNSPVPPIVAFLIVSYVIASLFLSVYNMANDTIIQSYILDEKFSKIDLSAPDPLVKFMRNYHKDDINPDAGCC
jgi:Plasma-membrane choline transporter